MIKKCQICGKEFEVSSNRGNRIYCYDCSPKRSDIGKDGYISQAMKTQAIKFFDSKCVVCGYDRCQDALDFHHVNEDSKEFLVNRITNWECYLYEISKCILVCANCHREIHSGLIDVSSIDISKFNIPKVEWKENFDTHIKKEQQYCKTCGKEISGRTPSGLCSVCANKEQRKVERPQKDELLEEVLSKPIVQVAKKYGVSDNAIRKWCRYYDLPYRKKDIERYKEIE